MSIAYAEAETTLAESFTPPARADAAPAVDRAAVTPARTETALFHCLVLCDRNRRGRMFQQAAGHSGWDVMLAGDAEAATRLLRRQRFQLVIVDLVSDADQSPAGFRGVAEHVARGEHTLLMIAGNEGDALEEIWARQLGAWLYLPGVDEQCDVIMLCDEAQRAADKLYPDVIHT